MDTLIVSPSLTQTGGGEPLILTSSVPFGIQSQVLSLILALRH